MLVRLRGSSVREMGEREYEFGLDSFMGITAGLDGEPIAGDQVVRDTVEEGVLAEQVGIDSFNIGEHYRDDMMDSAAPVVLAAIAGRTERIRLGTAVTVLSTQDPVRLYNNFATLDAVSGGRAQLIVGRGSAIESFPLLWLRPPRLRGDLRGEAGAVRGAAARRTDHLVREVPAAAERRRPDPAAPGRQPPDLGWLRRQPRVGDPRRTLRATTDARCDRWKAGTVPPACRPLPPRVGRVRAPDRSSRRAAYARLRRRYRRRGDRNPMAVLAPNLRSRLTRTRLAPAHPRAVRRRDSPWCDVRRLPRDRRTADRARDASPRCRPDRPPLRGRPGTGRAAEGID